MGADIQKAEGVVRGRGGQVSSFKTTGSGQLGLCSLRERGRASLFPRTRLRGGDKEAAGWEAGYLSPNPVPPLT